MGEPPYSIPTTKLSLTRFQLNASIHHAPTSVAQRAVRDFGGKIVTESKHEIINHFTTELLDEVADLIISKASDSFLDKCLAKRLLTIEAKPLINALAAAERLGYEPGDIIQEEQRERVIPQEAYPGATAAANGQSAGPDQPSAAYPQPSRKQLQCMKCFRTFVHTSAFGYVSEDFVAPGENDVCLFVCSIRSTTSAVNCHRLTMVSNTRVLTAGRASLVLTNCKGYV